MHRCGRPSKLWSYAVLTMPSKDPREADSTLLHALAVKGADFAELEAGRNRRLAAETLFEAMDGEQFDLDLAAIDRLNADKK